MAKHLYSTLVAVATMVVLVAGSAATAQQTEKALADAGAQCASSLVMVQIVAKNEGENQRAMLSAGVCVAEGGIFMTYALNAAIPPELISDCQIIIPGQEGKTIKAKFMGSDPVSGLSFVQATESYPWKPVKFAAASNLQLGQMVISAGLSANIPGFPPAVGVGYVSSMMRTPIRMARITGGSLTSTASPVFNSQGLAIGIVCQQPYVAVEVNTEQGSTVVSQSPQEFTFFIPVEEISYILAAIPSDGKTRRPAWIGINRFEIVNKDTAAALQLQTPGIMIDQVIPGDPADKAGLKDRDIIIAIDDQPIEKLATPDMTVKNFNRNISIMQAGKTLTLTVLSGTNNAKRDAAVTLASMPTLPDEAKRAVNYLGFVVREKVPLDKFLDKSPTADVNGLMVMQVVDKTIAAKAGLKPGDLITAINDRPVATIEVLKQISDDAAKTNPPTDLKMTIQRGNQMQVITLTPPQK